MTTPFDRSPSPADTGAGRAGAVPGCATLGAMAYDEELAHRIRALVATQPGLSEKKMFGGVGFLVGGHLAVSASGRGAFWSTRPRRVREASGAHEGHCGRHGRAAHGGLAPRGRGGRADQAAAGEVGDAGHLLRPLPPGQALGLLVASTRGSVKMGDGL